ELPGEELGQRLPGDPDVGVAAPPVVGPRAALQPAGADGGLRDPRAVANGARDIAEEWGWADIAGKGLDADHLAAFDDCLVGAPVRRMRLHDRRHACSESDSTLRRVARALSILPTAGGARRSSVTYDPSPAFDSVARRHSRVWLCGAIDATYRREATSVRWSM